MRDKCVKILTAMRAGGVKDLVENNAVEEWTDEECEYLIVNYGSWIEG